SDQPKRRKRRGWGEGGVYQRSDGLWVGSVSLGYASDGKRRRRAVYAATKTEVQKELRKLQTQADARTLRDVGRLTVDEYISRWLETTARQRVHATTFQQYSDIANRHVIPLIGSVKLS